MQAPELNLLWYLEVAFELCLFALLWFKDLGLRWFSIFIGVDVVAGLLQFSLYRSGYHHFSAWIWEIGVIAWIPLMPFAFIEAADNYANDRRLIWKRHIAILSFWISILFACKSAAFSRMFPMVNQILLVTDCFVFVAWSCLFFREPSK